MDTTLRRPRFTLGAFALFLALALPALALAAGFGSLSGSVTTGDEKTPVAHVQVIATGIGGGGRYSAVTDDRGAFLIDRLPAGNYRVSVQATTFAADAQLVDVADGQSATVAIAGFRTIASVVIAAPRRLAPGKATLFRSAQTQVVLDQNILKAQAPLAGSEQILAAAPGVMQASYGSTGAAKGMISLRGFKQGWANQAGIVDDGLFGVTLNGVYLNNPQTGIWEPDEVPDLSIISGSQITFGPGDAATRTFDSMGGSVDFYTILPSKSSTFRTSFTTGSYGGSGYHFDYGRAISPRYSFLVAQGRTFTQGFRDIIGSGSAAPGSTYGTFGELQDLFGRGSLLFFGYSAEGVEYRPNLVPVTPLAGPGGTVATVNGFDLNGNPIPGTPYSQATSGFYSALPANVWQKTDSNATRLVGVDLTYDTSGGSYLTNQAWIRRGDRLHVKDFNWDQANNTSRFENNNPFSIAYGDSFTYHFVHGNSDIAAGWNLLYSHYLTRNAFYNPDPVQSNPSPPTSVTEPANFRSNDFWMSDLAFFVQDDLRFGERAELIPGIRAVALNTSFVNNGLVQFPLCADPASPCFGNNHTSQPNSTTSFHRVEPSASFRYAIARDLAGYVSYGQATRNPQTSPGGPYQRVSVEGLQPEITNDTEAGLKFYRPLGGRTIDGAEREASASLGFFRSSLLNQNIPLTTGQGTKVSSASGSSQYAGLTFAFDSALTRTFSLFGSYSITHAVFTSYTLPGSPSYNGLPITQTPVNTGTLGVVESLPVGSNVLTGRLYDQFVGAQAMWDNSGLNNGYQGPDLLGRQIPAYNLINGSLEYRLGKGAEPISFLLSATNLFDRQYNVFEYITSGAYFGGGIGQGTPYGQGQMLADPGPPREVQFSVSLGI